MILRDYVQAILKTVLEKLKYNDLELFKFIVKSKLNVALISIQLIWSLFLCINAILLKILLILHLSTISNSKYIAKNKNENKQAARRKLNKTQF